MNTYYGASEAEIEADLQPKTSRFSAWRTRSRSMLSFSPVESTRFDEASWQIPFAVQDGNDLNGIQCLAIENQVVVVAGHDEHPYIRQFGMIPPARAADAGRVNR